MRQKHAESDFQIFFFVVVIYKKKTKMFRQNEQKQLWFINNTHTIYSWNNNCLEIRWFSQSVSIAERCRDSLLSRCLPCDSQLELFLFIHSALVTSLLAPAVVPSCTKSIAFKTVDSHSPRLASCTMLEQMKSERGISPDRWFPLWKQSCAQHFSTHFSPEPEHSCWFCSAGGVAQILSAWKYFF